MGNIVSISTIGQDSHRFGEPCGDTLIRLGGIDIPFDKPIEANSDGDVVFHAITNAISGFTGVNILGGEADKICLERGIKDSSVYLEKALEYLTKSTSVTLAYRIAFSAVSFIACITAFDIAWNISDIFNALMIIPNAICMILLAGPLVKDMKDFDKKRKLPVHE